MASVWDFLGGAAATHLNTVDERDKAKAEEKKMRMIEGLRRETEEWKMGKEDEREGKKVDTKLSYPDYEAKMYRAVNSNGDRVPSADRQLTESEIKANDLTLTGAGLDIDYKRAQIGNMATDNEIARGQLDVSRGNLGLARRRLDEEIKASGADSPTAKRTVLYGTINKIDSNLSQLGMPSELRAKTRATMQRAVDAGAGQKWLSEFESSLLSGKYVEGHTKLRDKLDVQSRYFTPKTKP